MPDRPDFSMIPPARIPKLSIPMASRSAVKLSATGGPSEGAQVVGVNVAQGGSGKTIVFVENNLRSTGGHFLDMARLMAMASHRRGDRVVVATHQNFDQPDHFQADCATGPPIEIHPIFRDPWMAHWSLGVDGRSATQRDHGGRPLSSDASMVSRWRQCRQSIRDRRAKSARRPDAMLNRWAEDLLNTIKHCKIGTNDAIIINTADDFQMLALAKACRGFNAARPLTIHVIFHLAAYLGDRPTRRSIEMGQQVKRSIQDCEPHRVVVHATTSGLCEQLRRVGVRANLIAYPMSLAANENRSDHVESERPIRVAMAGGLRAEKGTRHLGKLLEDLMRSPSGPGRPTISLQAHPKQLRRLLPRRLRRHIVHETDKGSGAETIAGLIPKLRGDASPWIECVRPDLGPTDYHRWIQSSDVGLFLYDARRYAVRCSAALLDMMLLGKPVIVPADTWMAEQVTLGNDDGEIGLIYEHIDDVPGLIEQLATRLPLLAHHARRYAAVVAERHHPEQTVRSFDATNVSAGMNSPIAA